MQTVRRAFRPSAGLLATLLTLACIGADGAGPEPMRDPPPVGETLFTRMPAAFTGVRFENRVEDTPELNIFTYRNFYNGGGVALGDLTGNGLPDLFLTSNLESNRLYLNEGEYRFRDVTAEAGVAGAGFWATGAVFVDINGNGLLDLYVTYAGNVAGERRANELHINQGLDENGVPRFVERAAEYGLADEGYTTHAVFFDYDGDGLVDVYLVNNSFRPVSSFGLRNIRHVRDPLGGDKLYRNTGAGFVDVSEAAGIYGSEIGFGLGAVATDVNRNGWPDLYVSNDFFERDYLYINNGDGTFTEVLDQQFPYISYFSMGLDIADLTNDGWPDIYVTDMLPADEYRLKTMASFEGWDVYQAKLRNDYHHQYMRNMLHRNNGDGTFSDIGQLAGVAATDWSWSALLADLDQDGYKDVFVTNGMPRDLTSQDYISFLAHEETMRSATRGRRVDFLGLVEAMASTPLPNFAFRNNGDLTFDDVSGRWGLATLGFANGAAYGDLNGDGALDLVVNSINQEAGIYRNNARTLLDHRWLQVRLEGEGTNRFAIGARVTLRAGDRLFYQELSPSRGFQSSVDYVLTFGLGGMDRLDAITVEWPDRRVSVLEDVAADQRITVRQGDASPDARPASPRTPPGGPRPFVDVTDRVALDYTHRENLFVDFDRERLIPKLLSTEGPRVAVGDVTGNGLPGLFIGGAKDQPGELLLQQPDGRFVASQQALFEADRLSEDVGAVFFDATGNGHLDLYVVSGGSEFSDMAPALQDRLYINDGRGGLRKATGHLPSSGMSGGPVAAVDFDGDGAVDLFVGGRVVPWRYGLHPRSALLRNDGTGRFADVTREAAPGLERIGMVTDALWTDVDGDGRPDLVVVGEWMPIAIFRNTGRGTLERMAAPGLERSHGWWNRVVAGDFTGNGHTDLVVGNAGLNTLLRAMPDAPATMHVKDFNGNGFMEQILALPGAGGSYPVVLRDELIRVLPHLKARHLKHENYAGRTLEEVFTAEELEGAVVKQAHTFASALVRNNGDGSFTLVPLPLEAQVAPAYGILARDFTGNGHLDLLLAGNFHGVKPQFGRMSAGYGLFLRNDGRGGFTPVPAAESGFRVPGQARDIQRVPTRDGDLYLVARNNDPPLVFRAARTPVVARRP
jgi:enediyne biosynthesis protein E4